LCIDAPLSLVSRDLGIIEVTQLLILLSLFMGDR